jgi:hypothetical protein
MKKSVLFFVLISFIILFYSCNDKKGGNFKVTNFSGGKAGEAILIMDDNYWSDSDKVKVENVLMQPQPAINQIEPMFELLKINNVQFTNNFQKHRNIVRFDISKDYHLNQIFFSHNVWSSPQEYIYIKGNDPDSCLALFLNNQDKIIKLLYDNDLKRIQVFYSRDIEKDIEKKIRAKFGFFLSVPQQYIIASEEADFMWLRFRTARNDRFIMIYKTPLKEMTGENLIATRDSITKKYIPGAIKGAYPIVAQKLGFPLIGDLQVGSRKGIEMRGLWESVRDKMGGPFYSFSFIDQSGQYVITVDGFVYAPQENKRDYLREVEAIVKSIR